MKNLITAACLTLAATVALAGPGKGSITGGGKGSGGGKETRETRDPETGVRSSVMKSESFRRSVEDLSQAFTAANKSASKTVLYRIAEHLAITDMNVSSLQAAVKSGDAQKVVVAENVLDVLASWAEKGQLEITVERDASGKTTKVESGVFAQSEGQTVNLVDGFLGQILTFSDSLAYDKAALFTKTILENREQSPIDQIRRASVHLTEAGGKDKAAAYLKLCTRKLNLKLI